MQKAVLKNVEDAPLFVILGSPMRGIRGAEQLQQHLTAWYLNPTWVKGIRLSMAQDQDDLELQRIGAEVEQLLMDWAERADVEWCRVLEDRNEVVNRRDYNAPLAIFRNRTVSVWGCGALVQFQRVSCAIKARPYRVRLHCSACLNRCSPSMQRTIAKETA